MVFLICALIRWMDILWESDFIGNSAFYILPYPEKAIQGLSPGTVLYPSPDMVPYLKTLQHVHRLSKSVCGEGGGGGGGEVNLRLLSHLLVAGFDIGVRFSVRPSVRLSTFMSTFDIYVKVSILINYKTKQPSNLAWNISLTSWLCNIGVRFSVCLSIHPSVCQHLCRRSTFMSKLVF